jgi:SPP1 family predicted phage head-tail adaptor
MLQSSVRRGELDRLVTFIKKVLSAVDTNEDYVASWVEVSTDPTVYCKKIDLSGNDVVIDGRLTYTQNTKLIIDFRTDITSENRAVIDGKVYEIIGVTDNNSSRGVYKDVMCTLLDTEEWS